MAEKIVSPGVFTNEVDQSFLPAGVAAIGAAVVGPTAKGPALIPTVVSSYSEFVQTFGGKIESGSGATKNSYKYLTNYAAQEYLKYADTLTVVRILAGSYTPAQSVVSSSVSSGNTFSSASVTFAHVPSGSVDASGQMDELTIGGVDFTFVSESAGLTNTATQIFVEFVKAGGETTTTTVAENMVSAINDNSSTHGLAITATNSANVLILSGSSAGVLTLAMTTGSGGDGTATTNEFGLMSSGNSVQGGTNTTTEANCFTLTTLSDGADLNSYGPEVTNNLLSSGSDNNIRWEITSVNNAKGTFNLQIRRGNDTSKRKVLLEQYNNLTLDPNSSDFISRRIGDQFNTLADSGETQPYLQLTGDYQNKSKYVRVTTHVTTYNYLDENGNVRDASLSGSLPAVGSGSFNGGSDGTVLHPQKFYDTIEDTNVQGFNPDIAGNGGTSYSDAIALLKNQDEYDINLITLPGLVNSKHGTTIGELIQMCEDRGDCFSIVDPVLYGMTIADATTQAESRDTNYAAMYWPWIKIPDPDLGRNVWVPAGTCIPSVYAFNDRVAAPWFAPAGLNRGGIDIAVQAQRKLTHANRDTLYESNVNPIATFPNAGVTVFGQKTLQKKASALDRVNVRRLLIAAKKFIASTTKFLVFENNTAATRNRFLSIVNPYFESVQQRQGLFAFKVVMDETNNTPDVIDRNQMKGQIFLQPAKTAEFIIIDFNILPTGAAFPE
jgi:hypothetical protein